MMILDDDLDDDLADGMMIGMMMMMWMMRQVQTQPAAMSPWEEQSRPGRFPRNW